MKSIQAYLEKIGGKDSFVFTKADGSPDQEAADKFKESILTQLPRECVSQSYNTVVVELKPVAVR